MGRGKAIDRKVREIIINQYYKGKTVFDIASELSVAKSTVFNIIKKFGESGNFDIRGKNRIVNARNVRQLVKVCKKGRRNTFREIIALWNTETGINASRD